jgi:hypothetical protein
MSATDSGSTTAAFANFGSKIRRKKSGRGLIDNALGRTYRLTWADESDEEKGIAGCIRRK